MASSASPIAQAVPQSEPVSESTEWRDVQLRYKLAPSSFKNLLAIRRAPSRQDVLRQACFCTELSAFPLNPGDRGFFRQVNDHSPIPYRITETLTQPWHKVFLIVQIDLARCGWPNKLSGPARKELHSERGRIYRVLDQVLRCLVDILGQRLDGTGVVSALDVLRSVKANVWEGNDMELLQVEGIGLSRAQKLVQAGIKTVRQLAKLECYHIERLVSRQPPFGQHVLHQLAGFPRLDFTAYSVEVLAEAGDAQSDPQSAATPAVLRVLLWYENDEAPVWNKKSPWTTLTVTGDDGRLLWFWRGSVKRLPGRKDLLLRIDARPNETVQVVLACEEIVGTLQRKMIQIKTAISQGTQWQLSSDL